MATASRYTDYGAVANLVPMAKPPVEPDFSVDEVRWRELMISLQAGNADDYRKLLAEVSLLMKKYFSSRIAGEGFVEDCVQEVLIALHEARHTYDPARKFRPWLFAIARHKAIDCLRRGYRQPEHVSWDSHSHEQIDAQSDVEAQMVGNQLMQALTEPLRDAVTLTRILGFSSAEAAARLSISEGTLKVRVHRGVRRLKKLLQEELI